MIFSRLVRTYFKGWSCVTSQMLFTQTDRQKTDYYYTLSRMRAEGKWFKFLTCSCKILRENCGVVFITSKIKVWFKSKTRKRKSCGLWGYEYHYKCQIFQKSSRYDIASQVFPKILRDLERSWLFSAVKISHDWSCQRSCEILLDKNHSRYQVIW